MFVAMSKNVYVNVCSYVYISLWQCLCLCPGQCLVGVATIFSIGCLAVRTWGSEDTLRLKSVESPWLYISRVLWSLRRNVYIFKDTKDTFSAIFKNRYPMCIYVSAYRCLINEITPTPLWQCSCVYVCCTCVVAHVISAVVSAVYMCSGARVQSGHPTTTATGMVKVAQRKLHSFSTIILQIGTKLRTPE